MKALRTTGLAMVAVMLAGASMAVGRQGGAPGQGRVGLGMNLGTAEATYALDTESAVGAGVSLDLMSGDFDSTDFGLDAWYQKTIKDADPVKFFWLGGLGFGSKKDGSTSTTKTSGFRLFAGIGTEYFLPGTKSLSIEAKVGLMINFLSEEFSTTVPVLGTITSKASGTEISFKDLTGGLFVIRYYLD